MIKLGTINFLLLATLVEQFMISSAEKEWSSHVRNTQLKKHRITCRDKEECIKLEDYYGTDSNNEKFSLSATDLSYLDDACSCKHVCKVHYMVTKGGADWDLHIMYDCDDDWCKKSCPVRLTTTTLTAPTARRTDADVHLATAIAVPLSLVLSLISVVVIVLVFYRRNKRQKTFTHRTSTSANIARRDEEGGFSNPVYTPEAHSELPRNSNTMSDMGQRDTSIDYEIVEDSSDKIKQYDHLKGSFMTQLPNYDHVVTNSGYEQCSGTRNGNDIHEDDSYSHLNRNAVTTETDQMSFDTQYSHLGHT